MKDLIEKWKRASVTLVGMAHRSDCIQDVESYLAACAPRTTPPTVEEFMRHEERHGPWMRIRVSGYWCQAHVVHVSLGLKAIDPMGNAWLMQDGMNWQFSDSDSNAVPGPDWKP